MSGERRYRALLLGNWDFPEAATVFPPLIGPPTDVDLLYAALTDPERGLHRPDDVEVVRNASVMTMRRKIEIFLQSGRSDEQLLVYYSGHGRIDDGGRLYFCAHDTSPEAIRTTTVHADDMAQQFKDSWAGAKILILDCCYSGNYRHKSGGAVPGRAFDGRGVAVLSSAPIDRLSPDAAAPGEPSVFTGHLVDALLGGAGGLLTFENVYDYICERMEAAGRLRPAHDKKFVGQVVLGRADGCPSPPTMDADTAAIRLASAYQQSRTNHAAAAATLRELTESAPEHWSTLAAIRLGDLAGQDGDDATAIEAYERVVGSGHPEWSALALVELGERLNAAGETDRAAATWRRAVGLDHPVRSPDAARRLGRLLTAAPATAPAGLVYYRQALHAAGADDDLAQEVSDVLLRLGEIDEARALARRRSAQR